MALTILDPKTALITIDLQAGIVALPTNPPTGSIVQNAAELAAAFRRHGLPVVLVNVAGGAPGRTDHAPPNVPRAEGWTELVPELDQQPSDHTITKRTWGAFTRTGLEELLKGLGVTQVVIAGVSTSAGVESTARSAFELGFNVTLAIDAMTDLRPEAHVNSVERIFPRLGETGKTREIIALLDSSRG